MPLPWQVPGNGSHPGSGGCRPQQRALCQETARPWAGSTQKPAPGSWEASAQAEAAKRDAARLEAAMGKIQALKRSGNLPAAGRPCGAASALTAQAQELERRAQEARPPAPDGRESVGGGHPAKRKEYQAKEQAAAQLLKKRPKRGKPSWSGPKPPWGCPRSPGEVQSQWKECPHPWEEPSPTGTVASAAKPCAGKTWPAGRNLAKPPACCSGEGHPEQVGPGQELAGLRKKPPRWPGSQVPRGPTPENAHFTVCAQHHAGRGASAPTEFFSTLSRGHALRLMEGPKGATPWAGWT